MKKLFRSTLKAIISVIVLAAAGTFFVNYYSWIFAKTVSGKIVDVQRITDPTAIIGGSKLTAEQLHAYSILIEGDDRKMYTASSEDRQWQVAAKGLCVTALLYRYPFWDLEKSGTFFNARVKEIRHCPGSTDEVKPPAIENSVPSEPAAQ